MKANISFTQTELTMILKWHDKAMYRDDIQLDLKDSVLRGKIQKVAKHLKVVRAAMGEIDPDVHVDVSV